MSRDPRSHSPILLLSLSLIAIVQVPRADASLTSGQAQQETECSAFASGLNLWPRGESVLVSVKLTLGRNDLPEIEKEVRQAVFNVAESGLSALGFKPVMDNSAESVIEIVADGEPVSARYGLQALRGLPGGTPLYLGARWKGVIRVRRGLCLYQQAMEHTILPPESIQADNTVQYYWMTGRTKPSDAPLQNAMVEMLATAMAQLAQDLGGNADLNRVVKTSSNPLLQRAAVSRITDQNVLIDIAKSTSEPDVGMAALEKVVGQLSLAQIAETASVQPVRYTAVEKLTDQAALFRIVESSKERSLWEAAIRKLDQASLITIYKTHPDSSKRWNAVCHLTDQARLTAIAKTDRDEDVRSLAVSRLNDEALLHTFAKTDKSDRIRRSAENRLVDLANERTLREIRR
jgi:hypothetical protein